MAKANPSSAFIRRWGSQGVYERPLRRTSRTAVHEESPLLSGGLSLLLRVTASQNYGVWSVQPPILLLHNGCIANVPVVRTTLPRPCHAHASPISPRLPAHAVLRLTCGSVWLSASSWPRTMLTPSSN